MAAGISRYRTAPPDGPPQLRRPPVVTAAARHVLRAGERLDHLSSLYYGTPLHWWRICDANPEFGSPLALVGADPVTTTVVPLRSSAGDPPWNRLRSAVVELHGVRAVVVVDEEVDEEPVRELHVTHNRAEVVAEAVADAVRVLWPIGPVVERTRVGQEVLVPPPATGAEDP